MLGYIAYLLLLANQSECNPIFVLLAQTLSLATGHINWIPLLVGIYSAGAFGIAEGNSHSSGIECMLSAVVVVIIR
jgi:hypothetical protein